MSETHVKKELCFALDCIRLAPDNDAAWNYALAWVEQLPPGAGARLSERVVAVSRDFLLQECDGMRV